MVNGSICFSQIVLCHRYSCSGKTTSACNNVSSCRDRMNAKIDLNSATYNYPIRCVLFVATKKTKIDDKITSGIIQYIAEIYLSL